MVDRRVGTGVSRPVRVALGSTSVYTEEAAWSEPGILADYRTNPRLNALFLVHPENVKELAKHGILPAAAAQALAERVGREGKAVYAFERTPGIYGFVVVGKNAETVQALVEQLARAKKSFLGFLPGDAAVPESAAPPP